MRKYFLSLLAFFALISVSSAKNTDVINSDVYQNDEEINLNFEVIEDFSSESATLDEDHPNCLPVIICIACPTINIGGGGGCYAVMA